jgi:Voltage-dependent anion channel
MLVAGGAVPYSRLIALIVFLVGCAFTLCFAIWRTGGLWFGERDQSSTTPVLYLPTVAGSFVAGTVAAAFGRADWGQFAFGAGLFSWLAIESVLLNRLLTGPTLASALRPTLGIQLAPAPVGAVALLSVAPNESSLFAHAMIGYGLLQGLVLLRLLPWIMQEPFAPSYWALHLRRDRTRNSAASSAGSRRRRCYRSRCANRLHPRELGRDPRRRWHCASCRSRSPHRRASSRTAGKPTEAERCTSRHFIAPQQLGRFRDRADIEPRLQSRIYEYTP